MRYFVVVLLIFAGGTVPARASSLVTLAAFNNTDGAAPVGSLIADAAGDLFGTTVAGGSSTYGTVFEIAKTGNSFGSLNTLATFNGTNGANPYAGLITDAAGNLFGTTTDDETTRLGTVFEIANTGNAYGSLSTLASFNYLATGGYPHGSLIADAAGNLFGSTADGGTLGGGTVFEITKTGNTYGTLSTIASFNYTNGGSYGGLTTDAAGDLFGTAMDGYGTVFEIAKTGDTYGSPTTLATFNGTNGQQPYDGVIVDAAGDLFGTTAVGGTSGDGTVFEIAKAGNTYGALTTLASFNGTNGSYLYGGLIADAAGDLFGTTTYGGTSDNGTVFEIAKTGNTYGSPTTLINFNGTNGQYPQASLIADSAGDLFGTTPDGGSSNHGTVFEITGSGFVTSQTSTSVPEPDSIGLLGAAFIASVLVPILSRRRPKS